MLKRPMVFTGTSGTVRFDLPADVMLARIMDSELEHHMALAYSDHRQTLREVAACFNLLVIDLSEEQAG